MVKSIIGTPYENRQMLFNMAVNTIESVIDGTGKPYVKAKCLLPLEFGADIIDPACETFRELVTGNDVNWKGTQMLGIGVISPALGYFYLIAFEEELPIGMRQYHWKKDESGVCIPLNPPQPCTREQKVAAELTEKYSELIKTDCTPEDLRKYAKAWPEDRILI